MSGQPDKAVPLLAGEPFCEKPPLTYWVAGAAIHLMGDAAWVARLPNLFYAAITVLAVGLIGRRSAGATAGLAAAVAIGTFLLFYQVAIWLATDAPLLAAVAAALLGLHIGFYAAGRRERLVGYSCMHVALALGFLAKSAAAWMVPVLTLLTLIVWERRWRELLRWELYLGLGLQAAIILPWVWAVYVGPAGADHLKVFFWNNLVGRFAQVDAPEELQYAAAHRNSPGKYLIELPVYLWPWTLLVPVAARRAWQRYRALGAHARTLRFAVASFVPTLAVLSVAATARNIYLAPALPGIALLLGWWAGDLPAPQRAYSLRGPYSPQGAYSLQDPGSLQGPSSLQGPCSPQDPWDRRALRGTAVLLLLATVVMAAAMIVVGRDSWDLMGAPALQAAPAAAPATPISAAPPAPIGAAPATPLDAAHAVALPAARAAADTTAHAATPAAARAAARAAFGAVSGLGLLAAAACALAAWRAAGRGRTARGLVALLFAYAALLVGPASQLYRQVDAWQDLASLGRAIQRDAAGRPLILFAPDETTRAFIDMYARPTVDLIPGPLAPQSVDRLRITLASEPRSVVVTQLPGRSASPTLRELEDVLGMARHAGRRFPGDDSTPGWVADVRLRIAHSYALPNGRRYALLESGATGSQ
jgi:hypothetical protein